MGAGTAERRASKSGQTRLPNLASVYRYRLPRVRLGDWEFSWLLIGASAKPISLDRLTEGATWTDDSAVLHGNMTVRRPDPDRPQLLTLAKGMVIRCRVRWGGGWYDLWDMRIIAPTIDPVTGAVDLDLQDDLALLDRDERDWHFRKTHQRKRGWTLDEVVRYVCKTVGIKVGSVPRGKRRFTLNMKNATALDVIRAAIRKEQDATLDSYVIRMRGGHLQIVSGSIRNTLLYEFREEFESAQLIEESADRPTTVIIGKGRIGKGKHAQKVEVTVFDRSVVRKLGRVSVERDYGRVSSRAELLRKAKRDYAKAITTKRTASFTVRGIPFLGRGQGLRWITHEPGWYGKSQSSRDRSYIYTTQVTHTVQNADYTMDVTVNQADPFFKDEQARNAERRRKARERRKRRRKHG